MDSTQVHELNQLKKKGGR